MLKGSGQLLALTKHKAKAKGYLSVQARIKAMASASVRHQPKAKAKPKALARDRSRDRSRDKVEVRVGAIVKLQYQCLLSLKMILGMVRWELLRPMVLNMGLWAHRAVICRHMLCLIELNMEPKVLWAHL